MCRRLNDEQEASIREICKGLPNLKGTEDLIRDLLGSWQSSRTTATKKAFATFSLIAAAITYIGVDYTDFSLLGIRANSEAFDRLSHVLIMLIVVFGVLFCFYWLVDLLVRETKLRGYLSALKQSIKAIEAIKSTINLKGSERLGVLASTEHWTPNIVTDWQGDTIQIAELFQASIRGPARALRIAEWLEPFVLIAVASYGVLGLR